MPTSRGTGETVSLVNATAELEAPTLPARSVTWAVSDLTPSAPRSALVTEKSTKPAAISPAVSTIVFAGVNDAPPIRSSIVSPARAPEVPSPTRNVVGARSSTKSRYPSESLDEPCSAGVKGALGAVTSLTNVMPVLTGPMLPA